MELPPYSLKAGSGREVDQQDAALNSVLVRMAEHRRRRTFLLSFAQSPGDVIQSIVAAQASHRQQFFSTRVCTRRVPQPNVLSVTACCCGRVQGRELRLAASKEGEAYELLTTGVWCMRNGCRGAWLWLLVVSLVGSAVTWRCVDL